MLRGERSLKDRKRFGSGFWIQPANEPQQIDNLAIDHRVYRKQLVGFTVQGV